MLAEHIVSGKGVIRVANFEGVNIQMALEGDEGIDYEYGDTYEATTTRGCAVGATDEVRMPNGCLLYTSPSPRDRQKSRMPSSA